MLAPKLRRHQEDPRSSEAAERQTLSSRRPTYPLIRRFRKLKEACEFRTFPPAFFDFVLSWRCLQLSIPKDYGAVFKPLLVDLVDDFSVIGHTITTLSIGDDHNSWTVNPVLNQAVFVFHCFSCLFPVNCAPLQVPLQEWQWWNQVLDLLEVHNEPVIPSHLRRTRTSPKDWTDGTGDWSPAIFSLEKYIKIWGWTGQCSGSKGYSIFRGTHQE